MYSDEDVLDTNHHQIREFNSSMYNRQNSHKRIKPFGGILNMDQCARSLFVFAVMFIINNKLDV